MIGLMVRCEDLIQRADQLINDQQDLMDQLELMVDSEGDTIKLADDLIDALDSIELCIDGHEIRIAAKLLEGKK